MPNLTREQVEHTLGPLDDVRIAEILATGATMAEAIEAQRWLAGDKRTLSEHHKLRPSIIDRVMEIVRSGEVEWEET